MPPKSFIYDKKPEKNLSLSKLIYGMETDNKKTPFGLLNNQVRIDNAIQSGGWFNIKGDRLGAGDLTMEDMARIAKDIPEVEAFIILNEADSTWNLPAHLDRTAPGIDYCISKAVWVIAKTNIGNLILRVRDDIQETEKDLVEKDGIKYLRITRADLWKSFNTPPPKTVENKAVDENKNSDEWLKKVKDRLNKLKTTTNPQAPSKQPSVKTKPSTSLLPKNTVKVKPSFPIKKVMTTKNP
jgi:hypothetical protein